MTTIVSKTDAELGQKAAAQIVRLLKEAISARGEANLLVSTGASQFSTFEALLASDMDWSRVTMFHLDEYVDLPVNHPASFQKYLRERFTEKVNLKRAVLIDGMEDPVETIRRLNEDISQNPIDVGVIGIGENAHIAFNDPPADFEIEAAYHVVNLDEACKRQQVGEGWFGGLADVPNQAISITPRQIMRCAHVISPVPGTRKAAAIAATLKAERPDPMVPASLLKTHPSFFLFLDEGSASQNPAV